MNPITTIAEMHTWTPAALQGRIMEYELATDEITGQLEEYAESGVKSGETRSWAVQARHARRKRVTAIRHMQTIRKSKLLTEAQADEATRT